MQDKPADDIFQDRFYSISAYTKVDESGHAFFTSYFNVKKDWTDSLQEKLRKSLSLSATVGFCPLLDHYSLLTMGLRELERNMKVSDMVHRLYYAVHCLSRAHGRQLIAHIRESLYSKWTWKVQQVNLKTQFSGLVSI